MSNGILSQEEINALMSSQATQSNVLTPIELDALGEVTNIAMGSAATALSTLLDRKVEITAPKADVMDVATLNQSELGQNLLTVVDFITGFHGSSVFLLSLHDCGVIVDLLLGGDGKNPPQEFNEIHVSCIGEVMNQMMGSSATSMSTMLNREVNISPPRVSKDWQGGLENVFLDSMPQVVRISFRLKVDNLLESSLIQLIPLSIARDIINSQLGEVRRSLVGSHTSVNSATSSNMNLNSPPLSQPGNSNLMVGNLAEDQQIQVQPVQFTPFEPAINKVETNNLGLIMDVPVLVSVELGRTQKTIREILDLGPGSIVELDKLAGESVDLNVNGKLLARGEVVVINENFGVRITEIVNTLTQLN